MHAALKIFLFALPMIAHVAAAATLTLTLTDQAGQPVNDAVLSVSTINGQRAAVTPQTVTVDQVDEMFVPHVRAISTGSTVTFPNSDHIRHHVYSFSDSKTFELPLYIGIEAAPITFDKAGLVTLGCNIHDHMLGYILVLDTPHYAEVNSGTATLQNLPAGELAIEIWHPRLDPEAAVQLTLTVGADETAAIARQLTLRPERMVRRAPRRGGSRY
ncbi:MAG: methylamine utilization protein [Pseudomonadota bacterium]